MHHNVMNDSDYIRKWKSDLEYTRQFDKSNYKLHKITRKNIKYNEFKGYSENMIVLGNTYMKPRLNGIWFNLMKKYKKEVIAGPSSSAILAHQLIFDISKVLPKTEKNKVMLLLCILADYSVYHHSISEVIQTYASEASLKPYTIDMDTIEYLKQYIHKYV